ncbi:MAG: PEP-CTERM sorting domain-containing protein [Candidatus Sumerlaeia bacterium]
MRTLLLKTLYVFAMLAVSAPAFANDEQILKLAKQDNRLTTATIGLNATLQFHMWVDPLKTNWIAWSQYREPQEIEQQPLIDRPDAGNIGLNDYAVLTVIAPDGARSPEYVMDQNDADGRSYGPQAVIFGQKHLTPDVARSTPGGEATLFDEGGVADRFFYDHGCGLYNFELKVYNAYGKTGGSPNLFLLKNAIEGYQVQPPVLSPGYKGMGMFWGGDNDDDDDDDDNPPGPKYPDLKLSGSFPSPPDEGGDIPGGVPFPRVPEVPIIPEPGTLALAALGLGMMVRLRRK